MILLLASNVDIASQNIKQKILKHYPFQQTQRTFQQNPIYKAEVNGKKITLVTLNEESINAQYLPQSFPEAELIVSISKHSSASGKPTLTVHTTGNFAEAKLGGLPRTLSVAPASAMQTALKALARYQSEMNLNYQVSYECTHHGPSLNVPIMFVELGSSEPQWRDSKAAEAVAHSAMATVADFMKTAYSAALGIGGPHYNEKFTRMALDGEAMFGHMIPKYAISAVNSELLSQCMKKTSEKVTLAILDWKGIPSQDKPKLLSALQEADLPYQKV